MKIYLYLCLILIWSSKKLSLAKYLASNTLLPEFLVKQHVALERQKRYVLYRDGDGAAMQLILGFGLPLDLKDESVTIGYVIRILYHITSDISGNNAKEKEEILVRSMGSDLKSNADIENRPILKDYLIPENKSKHKNELKDKQSIKDKMVKENDSVEENDIQNKEEYKINKPGGKRDSRRKITNEPEINNKKNDNVINGHFEMYSEGGRITNKENNDVFRRAMPTKDKNQKERRRSNELFESPKLTRWGLYKLFENMMEQMGYEGRSCMLRTICEAAEMPFTHKNGILGELVHILLTPSTTQEALSHSTDKDYYTAEKRGLMEDIDCQEMYYDCKESILELFSEVGMDYLMQ